MPRTVAIIGASFGGLGVARALEPFTNDLDVEVVLIDKRPYHEFHPYLYEVATGTAEGRPEDCEKILASGVCVNVHAYDRLLQRARSQFRYDEVVAIDPQARRLRFRGGAELAYDLLVLAVGSTVAYFNIAGLREHAIPLKTTTDALRIRRRILECIDRVRKDPSARASIVIGGGGATGVEFTAELARSLEQRAQRGELPHGAITVTLVEAGQRLLGMFVERASRAVLQCLHRLGVRVLLDTCVSEVGLGRIVLTPRPLRDGEHRAALACGFDGSRLELETDLVVWTGGIGFPTLPKEAGLPVDDRGRVRVHPDCTVVDHPTVFALGDCAAFLHPNTQQPLPTLASIAIRQAPVVAANVRAALDRLPRTPFHPPALPAIVPVGGKRAVFVFGWFVWVGFLPWALHAVVALRYFVQTIGVVRGFRLWWRGARVYVRND